MNKPTICQVLHSLVVGGAEVLADRLARQLGDRYHFVFACLDTLGTLGERLRGEGCTVEVIERHSGVDFGCMRRLARFWQRENVDLVQAHQYTPFFYSAAARRLRRHPPILFTEHGRFHPDHPRKKRILFNRFALRSTDRVVCVGECLRRVLVANEGIPAHRIGVIYNGVAADRFQGQDGERAAICREYGLEPGDLIVAQVARLDAIKDHLTAIRAIQRAARRLSHVRLLVVGDGPEREQIEAEIHARGMGSQVRMLGCLDDVARILKAADVFLLTSISEGIPVTVLEAMAAGLPVVSTDVGGLAEVVQAEETGLLTPAADDDALAAAILRLAEAPSLRREMGERGRRRVREVFSEEGMHAAYQAVYEEMLGV